MKIQPHCIMLIGLPGSGKTTYCKAYYRDYFRLSSDDYIEQKAIELSKNYNEIFNDYIDIAQKAFEYNFNRCIEECYNFIIDRTNLTVKSRRKIIEKIPKHYNISCIYFTPLKDVILQRNKERESQGRSLPDDVLEKMFNEITIPSIEEGFRRIEVL